VTVEATDPGLRLRAFVLDQRKSRLGAGGGRLLVVSSVGEASAAAGEAGGYDAAWVALDRFEGVDLSALGRDLARALRPGSGLECVLPGAGAPAPVRAPALRGTGDSPRERHTRFEGPVTGRVTPSGWRRALGPAFSWARSRALGVVLPGPASGTWALRRPALFGVLAAVEDIVGTWPVLRALGDQIVLEGARR
jgi:hypothetical protein